MKKTIIGPDIGDNIEEFEQSDRVSGLPHSRGVVVHTPTHKRVFISGTAPLNDEGDIVGAGNIKKQTRCILEEIERMVGKFGGEMRDIVRLGVHVADISDEEYLDLVEVREEFLPADHLPASTLNHHDEVGIEGMTVEMDADAFIPDDSWEIETIE